MTAPLPLEFVQSATDLGQLPPAVSEVAIVGRSNVGKSSLINAAANRKKLALVSNTPGRTRLLNLFALRGPYEAAGGTLMDLPGYGYAAASRAERTKWQSMIEGYLLGRDGLVKVVVLVDGEIGPTKLDLAMLEWATANDLPHLVVATKADKVKAAQRAKRHRDVATAIGREQNEVLWVSAAKGHGLDPLRRTLLALMTGRSKDD